MELSPLEAFQRYASLGPDFMTWFLVRILEDDLPTLSSEPALKVDIQGPLLFTGDGGEANKVTLAGDEAASAPEVLSALRQGKRLARAKFIFDAMEEQYVFVLDAETFDLRSVKLPVPNIADADQHFSNRLEALAKLAFFVEEYFEGFLHLRLNPDSWTEEAERWKRVAKGLIARQEG